MNDTDRAQIKDLFLNSNHSPLEIAEALDLDFRRVCAFLDKEGLTKKQFAIARFVRKAVASDAYWPPKDAEC